MAALESKPLRLAVAGDILPPRRFAGGHLKNDIGLPEAGLVLRVLVPNGFLAGPAEDEDVFPAIGVEVVGVGEEIICVTVLAAEFAGEAGDFDFFAVLRQLEGFGVTIYCVAFFKARPGVPIGADDDIGFAVLIKLP